MYYATLLNMAVEDAAMPFPRFLLVDTPETAGIDLKNLLRALLHLKKIIDDGGAGVQVILTTGEGKYPSELNGCRVMRLTNDEKLLRPRVVDASAQPDDYSSYVEYLEALPADHRDDVIREMLEMPILESQAFSDAMSGTNASDFYAHDITILSVEMTGGFCLVEAQFEASGSQDEDKMMSGDTITGTVKARIDSDGNLELLDVSADVVAYDDEEEQDPSS